MQDNGSSVVPEHAQRLQKEYTKELRRCINSYLDSITKKKDGDVINEPEQLKYWDGQWRQHCAIIDKQRPTITTDHDLFGAEIAKMKQAEKARANGMRPLRQANLALLGFVEVAETWHLATNCALRVHENGDAQVYFRQPHHLEWPLGLVHGSIEPIGTVKDMPFGALLSAMAHLQMDVPGKPSLQQQKDALRRRDPGYINRLFAAFVGRSI